MGSWPVCLFLPLMHMPKSCRCSISPLIAVVPLSFTHNLPDFRFYLLPSMTKPLLMNNNPVS